MPTGQMLPVAGVAEPMGSADCAQARSLRLELRSKQPLRR